MINQAIQDKDTLKFILLGITTILGIVAGIVTFFGIKDYKSIIDLKQRLEKLQDKMKKNINKAKSTHKKMEYDIDRLEYVKHQEIGIKKARDGLYESALEEFNDLLAHNKIASIKDENNPNSDVKARAYSWKAYIYGWRKDNKINIDKALEMIEEGLNFNSKDLYLLYNGAIINLKKGNKQKALEMLKTAIESDLECKSFLLNENKELIDSDWEPLINNSDFKQILGFSADVTINLPKNPIKELQKELEEIRQKLYQSQNN